jgi:hypothetical protein
VQEVEGRKKNERQVQKQLARGKEEAFDHI